MILPIKPITKTKPRITRQEAKPPELKPRPFATKPTARLPTPSLLKKQHKRPGTHTTPASHFLLVHRVRQSLIQVTLVRLPMVQPQPRPADLPWAEALEAPPLRYTLWIARKRNRL